MTSPITGIAHNATVNRAATEAATNFTTKGNWVMGLFMLGAVAATAKLSKDMYVGNEEREKQGVAAERANKDYSLMMFDAGNMSGKGPFWDGLRHLNKWMDLYGPYGIKEDIQEFRDKFHSIWKEVILPNLIPIGISVASIYGYFGAHSVHKPFKYAGKRFGKVLFSPQYASMLPRLAKSTFKGTINKLALVLSKAMKYPAVALGIIFMGAFGYKTWYEVDTGRAQDEYFRSELFTKDGKVESSL